MIPKGLENMFVSFQAHVFAVIVSEAKTLMSALRYARIIHSSYSSFSFQPSPLCVRNKSLLSMPSREHSSTKNDAFLPLYLHAGPQTSKQDLKSKANLDLFVFISWYLWPSGRVACCRCNRPIVLCFVLRVKSYRHYTF